ncbi:MAG TPA: substrate-binding domain-containing protein [Bradyrhizobium sp.]|nr:substrate-binding domain-containing protein [Bradyrhizobium sp.]
MENMVRVLSTLALKGASESLAKIFQAASGVQIAADFAPTLNLLERLKKGEAADIVILTQEGLSGLAAQGAVVPESCVDLARSFVGVAVKAGSPHPDITTEPALRAVLLGARSVAYSRLGASGIYFAQLIAKLGIADQINARATIVPIGFTAERLITDEADLAIQQISELKQVRGVEIVGPVPLHLQSPAVFSAGRLAIATKTKEADMLLAFLSSARVVPVLRESGLESMA